MPRIFGNRFGNVSQADGYLDDKKSVYNMFDQYFSSRRGGWFSKVVASGGTEINDGSHKYHVFLSPGTFTVTTGGRVDYLVVGNGGNGFQATAGGGGGGGGVSTGTNYQISSPQSVTVGGPGGSSFGPITSGNGQSATSPTGAGGESGTPDPTKSGGTGVPAAGQGGGGGGAGFAGSNATPTAGGNGGNGVAVPWASAPTISPAIPAPIQPSWIPAVGTSGYYSGGGGGSGADPTAPYVAVGGSGGLGGGGRGSTVDPSPFTVIQQSTSGVTYTGGGGGGGSGTGPVSGGSGIVIIRYRI